MEQHPVPQNISGFQFKLIGDITLKQFAYVAGGVVLAYIVFKFTLFPSLLRYPLAVFFGLLGFGLAFVPIEERPMDRWIIAFFKSIYAPTQYVWKKDNLPPDVMLKTRPVAKVEGAPKTKLSKSPAPKAVPTTPSKSKPKPKPVPVKPKKEEPKPAPKPPSPQPKKPITKTEWALGAPKPRPDVKPSKAVVAQTPVTGKRIEYKPKPQPAPTQPLPRATTEKEAKLKSEFQKKSDELNKKIIRLQKELAEGTIAKERLIELQQLLGQIVKEKEQMSKELAKLQKQAQEKDKTAIEKPTTYTQIPESKKATVKIVPRSAAARIGIPKLTDSPNVITGIVKDSQGTLLPNIIITVKDKEGVPMRALKTNKIGQFAASTPLTDGVYVINVEDPKKKYDFNQIEISLSGETLPPLEISAISEKDMMRAKLSHEIFGKDKI